jgi:hypothetical protein
MADITLLHRKEDRVPLKMFVNLSQIIPRSKSLPPSTSAVTAPESCPEEIGSPINSCRFDQSVEVSNLLAAWPIVNRIQTSALWSESRSILQATGRHAT